MINLAYFPNGKSTNEMGIRWRETVEIVLVGALKQIQVQRSGEGMVSCSVSRKNLQLKSVFRMKEFGVALKKKLKNLYFVLLGSVGMPSLGALQYLRIMFSSVSWLAQLFITPTTIGFLDAFSRYIELLHRCFFCTFRSLGTLGPEDEITRRKPLRNSGILLICERSSKWST